MENSFREKFFDKSHLKFSGARQSIPFENKSNDKRKMRSKGKRYFVYFHIFNKDGNVLFKNKSRCHGHMYDCHTA